MAWNVDQVYKFMLFLIRKNNAGGLTAGEFFFAWNSEQAMYHQDVVGRWQARANGKQGASTGLILNETDISDLAPFTVTIPLTISAGTVAKPSDIIHVLAMRDNELNKVTFLTHGQIHEMLKSVIDPASNTAGSKKCYVVDSDNTYIFFPSTLQNAVLTYIAAVTDVVWNFTFDGAGRQIYSSSGSVQPKWSQNTVIEITKRALASVGIGFKDADFVQYGKSAQLTGN